MTLEPHEINEGKLLNDLMRLLKVINNNNNRVSFFPCLVPSSPSSNKNILNLP